MKTRKTLQVAALDAVLWTTPATVMKGSSVVIARHRDGVTPVTIERDTTGPAMPSGVSISGASLVAATGAPTTTTTNMKFLATIP